MKVSVTLVQNSNSYKISFQDKSISTEIFITEQDAVDLADKLIRKTATYQEIIYKEKIEDDSSRQAEQTEQSNFGLFNSYAKRYAFTA